MNHGKLRTALGLVLLGLICQVCAVEAHAAEELQAREVKVTATRTERDLSEVPMSVGVVTGESLKRDPQTNIADMLAKIPGVTVMDGSMPGGKRVKIRGESPLRSLILIDGVKISEQKSMSGSAILMDTSEIERIEVIKGPASVLYGSEALGGVINIITKKGGPRPIGFSVNSTYDSSNDGIQLNTALFGSYEGFYYRFTASGLNEHDRHGGDGRIPHSGSKNRNFSGKLGYEWAKGEVYLKGEHYQSEIRIPVNTSKGVIRYGSNAGMSNRTDVTLDLPQWDRDTVTGGLELRDLASFLPKIKINGYAQNMSKKFDNNVHVYNWIATGMGTMSVTVDQDIRTVNTQDSYGGTFQSEWALGDYNYVTLGLDVNYDKLDAKDRRLGGYTLVQPPMGSAILTPAATANYRYKVDQNVYGLFIQDEITLPRDFLLTLGLRETWVNSSLKKNNNPDLENHGDKSDSRLVGSAGLVWTGIKDVALRASWGQGYRFPALNQLYLGTVHGQSGNTLPNPDLNPETSNSWEIGARINKGNWNVDVAGFYTYSKNYITTLDLNDGSGDSIFTNMDKARTLGAELAVDYTFPSLKLTPYATATYLYRRYENTIDTINGTRDTYTTSKTGTPPVQGLLGLKWERDVAANVTLFTDAYMHWAAQTKTYQYDSTYKGDYDITRDRGWQTFNFTVGLEGGEEHKWNVALSLRNIFDKSYTQADNTIQDPGFHAVITAGFEF